MTDASRDDLVVIPFEVGGGRYSIFIVLQDHNLDRIKNYDPAELPIPSVSQACPGMTLKDVIVGYATAAEWHEVERLAKQGEMKDALRLLSRNFRYRPERGDDSPVLRLEPNT